jgi:hypothetical protein
MITDDHAANLICEPPMHLPIAAEAELRRQLMRHPNAKQHIDDRAEIEFLPKPKLLKLARKLDVKSIIEGCKGEQRRL